MKSATCPRSLSISNKIPVEPIASGIPNTYDPIGTQPHNIASHSELGSPSNREP